MVFQGVTRSGRSSLAVLATLAVCAAGCVEGAGAPADVDASEARIQLRGAYTFVNVHARRCLDVAGGSAQNGALLELRGCSRALTQQFTVEPVSDGFVRLRNRATGKCVDVWGASQERGTVVAQYDCHAGRNQQFTIESVGRAVRFVSRHSGQALDGERRGTLDGTRIVQWPVTGRDNQSFEAVPVAAGDAGVPSIPSDGGGAPAGEWPTVSGFASVSSRGLRTTTGGGDLAPIIVTTCADLRRYLEDGSPRVLEIPEGRTLDCRTSSRTVRACRLQCTNEPSSPVFYRIPVGDQTCTSLADGNGDGMLDVPAGTLVDRPVTETIIAVKSNKTLRGRGAGASILGVSFDINGQSNVIVQNLHIGEVNPSLIEAGDGISINDSHHVWIDHCEFSMISDGYMDVRRASSAVTFSYNHIVGRNEFVCGGQHHYVSLADGSEITFHHNYWDHPSGRNPKIVGSARVHLYNNYYRGVSYFCASAGAGSEVLVEGNVYQDSRYPHWAEGGAIEARDNVYLGTTSTAGRDGGRDVFTPPYDYVLEPTARLASVVPASAGPGGFAAPR